MNAYVIILTLFWQCFSAVPVVKAADADILWNRAISMAKQGQMDMAFIDFRMLVHSYPDARQKPTAQLGLGEYHFSHHSFSLAAKEFKDFYNQYPKRQDSVIALAYLYKMAQMNGQNHLMEEYRQKIISSRQVAFIFKDSQSFRYVSGFQHKYEVVFYIDKIEVWVNGNFFVSVSI
jgi:outer membrane protein assembly factor BamD (BamD/ComL family)